MSTQKLGVSVLCAALFGAATVGCSGEAPTGPIMNDNEPAGSVSLPLTAQSGDVSYRLASARFTITGAPLDRRPRTISPPADTPVHEEALPVGSYSILLEDGWKLERRSAAERAFTEVSAELIVDNPQEFSVGRSLVTDVVFSFATGLGTVDLGQGRADVRIDVRDCSTFNTYASSLATFTVDCLGTIDQNSFALDAAGFLQRNFRECPRDPSKLQSIDDFLGLQYPRRLPGQTVNALPFAKDCIAGRWAIWKEAFDKSGVTSCPVWDKQAEIGTPTPELYDEFAKLLPRPPIAETRDRPEVLQRIKVNSIYFVSFAGAPPPQQCETPGACAAICAGGFPGFVIQQEGATVLTDPPPWQLDVVFSGINPFLRPGYYHPMSLYGPPPGEIFGHINRATAAEACSYYDSGYHFSTLLKPNCVTMPTGDQSCVSACIP
jgi:hypothetical protein